MPRVFSVSSWNVEHFKDEPSRAKRVADFINGKKGGPERVPDVFALFEVVGKDVYKTFMEEFPDHRFHLTEGEETQETFVGVHRKFQTFSTQRLEFKGGRSRLRPGLLLTLRIADVNYPLLFLHIKSGDETESFGLRDASIQHAFSLKKALDDAEGEPSNFIFLGDLNTMGIDDPVPWSKQLDFSSEEEIERIADWAGKRDMKLLSKDTTSIDGTEREVSWYNGSDDYEPTNLDHVVASDHMQIRSQNNGPANVSVLGWPKLAPSKWDDWFQEYSDHAMLYFEVWD
jgi:hypothetical protein